MLSSRSRRCTTAFLVTVDSPGGAPLSQSHSQSSPSRLRTMIRADLHCFHVSVRDRDGRLPQHADDRLHHYPAGPYRLWEVAGSAHYETTDWPSDHRHRFRQGPCGTWRHAASERPTPRRDPSELQRADQHRRDPLGARRRVFHWPPVGGDRRAASSRPAVAGSRNVTFVFSRDQRRQRRGGVRSPQVDAPIAALTGVGNIRPSARCSAPPCLSHLAACPPLRQSRASSYRGGTGDDQGPGGRLPACA